VPLAFESYERITDLHDGPAVLNLAWTSDERHILAVDLPAVVAGFLRAEVAGGLPAVQSYLVKDPYGEDVLGPAVTRFFSGDSPAGANRPGGEVRVTCAAGVTSLLHGLAQAPGGTVAGVVSGGYVDFPGWVRRRGGRVVPLPADLDVTAGPPAWVDRLRAAGAGLVFCERPSLTGDRLDELAGLRALCDVLAPIVVVVDESNANYHPPQFSAVTLAGDVDNLIVLRGLSKAYGLGGLRLGYAVASGPATDLLRRSLPPLLPSSLSLLLGREVLGLGDVTAPLRERIEDHRREMLRLVAGAGVTGIVPASRHLPYVLVDDPTAEVQQLLAARGIVGKQHPVWWPDRPVAHLLRLSVPLLRPRMDRLRQLLQAPGPGPG
jgi:histidinol-phosphate/aromatic aminotransferase/cobyric acid decarboxylase-like protein